MYLELLFFLISHFFRNTQCEENKADHYKEWEVELENNEKQVISVSRVGKALHNRFKLEYVGTWVEDVDYAIV